MKHICLTVCVAVYLFGCMHEKNADPSKANNVEEQAVLTDQSRDDHNTTPSSIKLIKVADYRFQVADAKKGVNNIERLVASYPAFIADSRMSVSGRHITHTLSIRIPPQYFERFLAALDSQSMHTDYRNITTTDVTKEFVDLEARLKTKKEVHDRLKEILRNRTGTIEDVLAAERQLGEVQEEIEAATSKLNVLKDRITYSRIEVEMYQLLQQEATLAPGVGARFGNAFTAGLHGTVDVLIGITHLWPMFIAILLGGIFYRRRKKN